MATITSDVSSQLLPMPQMFGRNDYINLRTFYEDSGRQSGKTSANDKSRVKTNVGIKRRTKSYNRPAPAQELTRSQRQDSSLRNKEQAVIGQHLQPDMLNTMTDSLESSLPMIQGA